MAIELASNALTTLEAVKDELSIAADDSSRDEWLKRQINVKSGLITKFLNRTLAKADYTEGLRGFGMPRIAVRNPPIVALTAIEVRDVGGLVVETIGLDEVTIEDAEFLFLPRGWPHTATMTSRGIARDPLAGTEEEAIVVTYTGGFVLPKDATEEEPRTLPWELEEACIAEVAARFGRRGFQAVHSEKAFSHSVTFRSPGRSGLLPETEAALARWRRVAQA